MEKAYNNVNIPLFLVDLLSLHIIFDLLYNISSSIFSHWVLRYQLQPSEDSDEKSKQKAKSYGHENKPTSQCEERDKHDCSLTGEDINMVMEILRIQYKLEGEELKKLWGHKEISCLFEEEEPSLQEVREVFEVFDQNGDGFIDARELQRVLCELGFRQGSKLDECKKMIRAFDENEDDKIDFTEFAKFMSDNV